MKIVARKINVTRIGRPLPACGEASESRRASRAKTSLQFGRFQRRDELPLSPSYGEKNNPLSLSSVL